MIIVSITKKLDSPTGDLLLKVDLSVENGKVIALYGESGAGKTSIFRMMAGLMKPDKGKIIVNNETWFDSDKNINLRPQQRKVGFMFQDYALFPNMTVKKNLEFALEKGQDKSTIKKLIGIIELHDLQLRNPETLSGGQKQRVALARALVNRPKILLLDEPLSALDIKMRSKLQDYILKIHDEFHLTILLISHDVGEIIKLSQKITRLENGKLASPENPFSFFTSNKISGKYQFEGEVIDIKKEDVVFIVSLLAGGNVIKIIAQESDIAAIAKGDKVIVASKAFNPILYKIQ